MKSSVHAYRNQQLKCEIANLTKTMKSNWPSDNVLLMRSEMNQFFSFAHTKRHTDARLKLYVRVREFAASAHTVHRTNFTFFIVNGKWWRKAPSIWVCVRSITHNWAELAGWLVVCKCSTHILFHKSWSCCVRQHTHTSNYSLRWSTADDFLVFSFFLLSLCVSNRCRQHWSKNQITAMWKSRLIKTAIKLTTGWRSIFT